MGKGDRKSKKGKLFRKSYGVSRPRKANKNIAGKKEEVEKTAEE